MKGFALSVLTGLLVMLAIFGDSVYGYSHNPPVYSFGNNGKLIFKIICETNCTVFIDGENKGSVQMGRVNIVYLEKGHHILEAKRDDAPFDVIRDSLVIKPEELDMQRLYEINFPSVDEANKLAAAKAAAEASAKKEEKPQPAPIVKPVAPVIKPNVTAEQKTLAAKPQVVAPVVISKPIESKTELIVETKPPVVAAPKVEEKVKAEAPVKAPMPPIPPKPAVAQADVKVVAKPQEKVVPVENVKPAPPKLEVKEPVKQVVAVEQIKAAPIAVNPVTETPKVADVKTIPPAQPVPAIKSAAAVAKAEVKDNVVEKKPLSKIEEERLDAINKMNDWDQPTASAATKEKAPAIVAAPAKIAVPVAEVKPQPKNADEKNIQASPPAANSLTQANAIADAKPVEPIKPAVKPTPTEKTVTQSTATVSTVSAVRFEPMPDPAHNVPAVAAADLDSSPKIMLPAMVFVKGGSFTMGNNKAEQNEKPLHSVTVKNYFISQFEVTQAEWVSIMGNNPSMHKNCDDCPVENINWMDAQKYITALNEKTHKHYRLPTEAEWEYAAKGGASSNSFYFSGSDKLSAVAWYEDNAGQQSHSVGKKDANELKLYDMCGNVWEWCSDWYEFDYYSHSADENPKGAPHGEYRVIRGGAWSLPEFNCGVTLRGWKSPTDASGMVGLRLVLEQ